MNKIKIIFAGTPYFAVPSLEALINDERFEIVEVITQPDKKIGRKQILTPPPIKALALENNIKVVQPEKIKNISNDLPVIDLMVIVAYGQIIPQAILDHPKYGCINVHGSLLPKYRGAACVQAPILNGDNETGVTIMQMDAGLDTGPILKQTIISLDKRETCQSLHNKLAKLGAETLSQVLIGFINGDIKAIKQDDSKASYIKQLTREDGLIDWSKTATEIERMVRALNPWPGTYFSPLSERGNSKKRGVSSIKIIEIDNNILQINDRKPGEMFVTAGNLAVQTGKDALIIKKLQLAGKKPITAKEYINSIMNNKARR